MPTQNSQQVEKTQFQLHLFPQGRGRRPAFPPVPAKLFHEQVPAVPVPEDNLAGNYLVRAESAAWHESGPAEGKTLSAVVPHSFGWLHPVLKSEHLQNDKQTL